MSALPAVSIVTISQFRRQQCLQILAELLAQQTYSKIVEWVIVEGSATAEEAAQNQQFIDTLRAYVTFPIHYVEFEAGAKLGRLRNKSNAHAHGAIIVCCDDDDYYPPTRVEHAVTRLMASDRLIAGCSRMLMYDYSLERLYEYQDFYNSQGELVEHHSTNNCLAYKREYLADHGYDDNVTFAEESAFTNQFTEPMVQLDSAHTIVLSSHGANTYHKRLIFMLAHQYNKALVSDPQQIALVLPETYRLRYQALLAPTKPNAYDIVYFAGGLGLEWDPRDPSLGGSEQAIVNLATQWQAMGKRVCVYTCLAGSEPGHLLRPAISHNGVEYFDWRTFPFEETFKTLIVWRTYGLLSCLPFNVKAELVCLDLHDNCLPGFKGIFDPVKDKIDKIFVKSQYHKLVLQQEVAESYTEEKIVIVPNGVAVDIFTPNPAAPIQRDKYRFCYASCYTRGLEPLLTYTWPIIAANVPQAELHVYYGMQHIRDNNLRNKLRWLLGQERVMDHGRRPLSEISAEKQRASFHLYASVSAYETDCISIRESLVAGAIPILSTSGVFRERAGVHFALDATSEAKLEASYRNLAYYCIKLLKKEEAELTATRQQLAASPTITTWGETARSWLTALNI